MASELQLLVQKLCRVCGGAVGQFQVGFGELKLKFFELEGLLPNPWKTTSKFEVKEALLNCLKIDIRGDEARDDLIFESVKIYYSGRSTEPCLSDVRRSADTGATAPSSVGHVARFAPRDQVWLVGQSGRETGRKGVYPGADSTFVVHHFSKAWVFTCARTYWREQGEYYWNVMWNEIEFRSVLFDSPSWQWMTLPLAIFCTFTSTWLGTCPFTAKQFQIYLGFGIDTVLYSKNFMINFDPV